MIFYDRFPQGFYNYAFAKPGYVIFLMMLLNLVPFLPQGLYSPDSDPSPVMDKIEQFCKTSKEFGMRNLITCK